jgi:hypothetical protein
MTTTDTIARAIAERRPIRFTYGGKPREADPHAMYVHPTTGTILVDAIQRGGAASGPLPVWRQFAVGKVVDLEVVDATFGVASTYRADSPRYVAAIAKVQPFATRGCGADGCEGGRVYVFGDGPDAGWGDCDACDGTGGGEE